MDKNGQGGLQLVATHNEPAQHGAIVIARDRKGMGACSGPQCILILLRQKSQESFNPFLSQGPSHQDSCITGGRVVCSKTRFHTVDQTGLQLTDILLLLPEFWDNRHELSDLVSPLSKPAKCIKNLRSGLLRGL